jgi:hypothetical protein
MKGVISRISSSDFIRQKKTRKIRWAGQVALTEKKKNA